MANKYYVIFLEEEGFKTLSQVYKENVLHTDGDIHFIYASNIDVTGFNFMTADIMIRIDDKTRQEIKISIPYGFISHYVESENEPSTMGFKVDMKNV